MSKRFISSTGHLVEIEREIKTLKLTHVNNSDYYKGKNHDSFNFTDTEGIKYIYDASLNSDMTEYDSEFAKTLAFKEGKFIRLSGYFLPNFADNGKIYIYNPRLLGIEE